MELDFGHLFGLKEFFADPVDIHNLLCRIGVSQNFSVKFADSLGLIFRQRITLNEGVDFLD